LTVFQRIKGLLRHVKLKTHDLVILIANNLQCKKIFHQCMAEMLEPLKKAGREGVEMNCGDGKVCRCYPILAAYIADNPEQTRIASCRRNLCYQCI
jgi:hypothetical protein